jgi:hypothetical protein
MYTLKDGLQVKILPDKYTGRVATAYGSKTWHQDGNLHRLDGPARVGADGSKEWYQHGKLHRLDGPAWEAATTGNKYWYQNGKLHQLNGHAVERIDGSKEWWITGRQITKATRIVLVLWTI